MIRLTGHEFAPAATFECGQCFRWTRSDDAYVGIAGGRVCRIRDGILSCPEADNAFWTDYFCLDMDYEAMKADLLARDPSLAPCVAYGEGLRILRQELWETIASFIISANNNIPRIRGIIESLCRSFGEPVEFEGRSIMPFRRRSGWPDWSVRSWRLSGRVTATNICWMPQDGLPPERSAPGRWSSCPPRRRGKP